MGLSIPLRRPDDPTMKKDATMHRARIQLIAPLLALALALAGCGGESADTTTDDTQATGDAAVEATAGDTPGTPSQEVAADAPLGVEDIDAYAAGMAHEIELLQATGDRVAEARAAGDDAAETGAIFELAMGDFETPAAGVAGLSPERYREVKRQIGRVLGAAGTQQQLATMGGDPDTMTPEDLAQQEATRAQLQAQVGDPYAGLAPDVAGEIKARFDELAELHARSIAIRMNAAG